MIISLFNIADSQNRLTLLRLLHLFDSDSSVSRIEFSKSKLETSSKKKLKMLIELEEEQLFECESPIKTVRFLENSLFAIWGEGDNITVYSRSDNMSLDISAVSTSEAAGSMCLSFNIVGKIQIQVIGEQSKIVSVVKVTDQILCVGLSNGRIILYSSSSDDYGTMLHQVSTDLLEVLSFSYNYCFIRLS